MQLPGVWIETILNPCLYSSFQIDKACCIAAALERGKLVLCERPAR